MTRWSRRTTIALFGLVALLLAPLPVVAAGAALSHPGAPAAGAPPSSAASLAGSAGLLASAKGAMSADHIPALRELVPNFHAQISTSAGYVQPLYANSPSPTGLGYFGIGRAGSHNAGSISYTSSVEGSLTMNSVDPFYLASTSPDIFTVQLNTVATHVTVLGNTSGEYWIQNVPLYYADSQTLSFEDNIWNFSAPGAGMWPTTLHSYYGQVVPGVFYYAIGPTMHMPTPFTVNVYNNLTEIGNRRPTVWFNYSVISGGVTVASGTYDKVEFNSAPSPTKAAAPALFQINGLHTNPIGLLNDAEIMVGGPGGGSTTTFYNFNGSMGLWLKSNRTGAYVPVPAGFSSGTDTGETAEGIAEYGSTGANPQAILGPGQSILQPLWGYFGTTPGYVQETLNLTPSNAFLFASQGKSFQSSTAAWGPVPTSGNAVYRLAAGHVYTFQVLLSDYKPQTVTLTGSSTLSIALRYDAQAGVYTPLWAWDDAQLAAISAPGGNGTIGNPFLLDNHGVGPLSPLFGQFNDYVYPVFPGILVNTNDFVDAAGLSDFPVSYSISPEAQFTSQDGLPTSNNLGLEFYNTSHLSLVDNAQLTGWAYSQTAYMSSVLFWNSSHDLIADNDFEVQGVGLQLFGGTNNVVTGNVFTSATSTAPYAGAIYSGSTQTGMLLYESGDTVYNNYFGTVYTAYTPTFNLYSGAFALWSDRWNVSVQASAVTHYDNGFPISGSILGLATYSGNFWSDYGMPGNPYGQLPYDEYGAITSGGDYHPVLPYALYKVVFDARNLTAGATNWSLTINGYTQTTSGLSLTFWEPAGTYAFVVATTPPYAAHPAQGAFTLTTHPLVRHLRFT